MRQAKRERTKKNEKQQMGNLKVALKQSGPRSLPGTVRLAASLPEHGKGRPSKRKDMEEDVRRPMPLLLTLYNSRYCWSFGLVAERLPQSCLARTVTACDMQLAVHRSG